MSERIERKILSISDTPRIWGDDRNGNGRAAEVMFMLETKDGIREVGEYRSTESAWTKVIERSTPAVGTVFTFDADPKKPYQGTTQWGLKSYPGKPEGDYKGGGGGGQKRDGDWETSAERADRRLNDAASKVLGVAAVLAGDDGSPTERASALGAIVPAVADAFLVARELMKGDFPVIGKPAPSAPVSGPDNATNTAPSEPKPATWGPAKSQDAAAWDHEGSADDSPDNPAELEHAWTQLAEATGSKAKALVALNRHFDRKANAGDYSFAEVMEVVASLAMAGDE